MPEIILSVRGMHCGRCTAAVEQALQAVPSVISVEVDLDSQTASTTVSEGPDPTDRLIAAIAAAGYEAAPQPTAGEEKTCPSRWAALGPQPGTCDHP